MSPSFYTTEHFSFFIDLASDSALKNAELYGIVDTIEVLWNKLSEVFFEQDPQKKVSIDIVHSFEKTLLNFY